MHISPAEQRPCNWKQVFRLRTVTISKAKADTTTAAGRKRIQSLAATASRLPSSATVTTKRWTGRISVSRNTTLGHNPTSHKTPAENLSLLTTRQSSPISRYRWAKLSSNTAVTLLRATQAKTKKSNEISSKILILSVRMIIFVVVVVINSKSSNNNRVKTKIDDDWRW